MYLQVLIVHIKEYLNGLIATETWTVPKTNHFHQWNFSCHLWIKNLEILFSISLTCMNLFMMLLIILSHSSWSVSSPFTP